MFSFKFLILFIFICIANQTLAFEYPQNLREQQYIENFFKEIPTELDVNKTLLRVQEEIGKQVNLANGGHLEEENKDAKLNEFHSSLNKGDDDDSQRRLAERYANLLNTYLDVANLTLSKCNLFILSDDAMLVKFHNHDAETSSLAKFLEHFIVEQVLLCKPIWERNFSTDLAKTKRISLQNAFGFLGSLVAFESYEEDILAVSTRPFPWKYMRKAIENVPVIPILAFMRISGYLKEGSVDDGLFDECYPRQIFREEYKETVLRMCKPLNDNILEHVDLFQFIFTKLKPLDERLLETNFFTTQESDYMELFTEGGHLLEWYSVGSICKKIMRSAEHKDKTGGKDVILEKALYKLTYEEGLSKLFPAIGNFFKSRFG